jgi:predicted acetylornithine/succinylornithine family transaminase
MSEYEQIVERERQYLLQTFSRYPLAITKGKGVWLWDVEGRKYLDFVSGLGVNALGHAHPRIVKVIREQAARAIHVSNLYYNEYQGVLAEKLCSISGMQRAFFCNSGTEAMEGALKLARLAGHKAGGDAKCKVVALTGSFHGRTFGAMSMTGQEKYRKGFEPLLEGVVFVSLNDVEALNTAVDDNTCAIVFETIQGEGGIREVSPEFIRAARQAADRHKSALILDEIQCGLGRTGTMFAYLQLGVLPDILTLAKPIAAGLPMGAILAREEVASAATVGKHGTTFGGGPLTCRVGLEVLRIIEEEGLLEQVRRVGTYMHQALNSLIDEFPSIAVEARGRGMMQALQLTVPGRPIVNAAMQDGVLINVTQDTVLRFLPPYLLEEKHVDKGIKVLRKLLKQSSKSLAASNGVRGCL